MARTLSVMAVDTHLPTTPAARTSSGLIAVTEPTRFDSPDAFRAWLVEHQDSVSSLWLIMAKKDSSTTALTYEEALTVALQYGWIDGQARRRDHDTYMQRFTPRRPRSPWSLRNRHRVEAMIDEGLMTARGLAEVERARADGRWDSAYEGQRNAEPHPDFVAALERNRTAKEFYTTLDNSNRYAVYYRLQQAKRAETRRRRIDNIVLMLARGEKFYG
ncbi:MAG TPA: YdeI/OmpD-associated family protein [Chloroflexota bacterium]|jgi:uncharacterized protein YdeI (YjbR/CyaY-like superfamily)|nr:YdeI/OmpD-associated family protein [Chloroflexota bacterium]